MTGELQPESGPLLRIRFTREPHVPLTRSQSVFAPLRRNEKP
jgi:hypothetical protein